MKRSYRKGNFGCCEKQSGGRDGYRGCLPAAASASRLTFGKYAGLGLNELRELRQLREENNKLKRLVADLPQSHILQEIDKKPRMRRELAEWVMI